MGEWWRGLEEKEDSRPVAAAEPLQNAGNNKISGVLVGGHARGLERRIGGEDATGGRLILW